MGHALAPPLAVLENRVSYRNTECTRRARLLVGGEGGVYGEDDELAQLGPEALGPLVEQLHHRLDLLFYIYIYIYMYI